MNCFILIFLTAEIFLMIDEQTLLDKYSNIVSEDKTSINGLSKLSCTKIFWNTFWGQNKHEQIEQTLPDKDILKYFLRSKQVWTDWANPSGQKYSKILSEVKASNPSGQKYFKIVSEVKTSMNRLSKSSWTKIF